MIWYLVSRALRHGSGISVSSCRRRLLQPCRPPTPCSSSLLAHLSPTIPTIQTVPKKLVNSSSNTNPNTIFAPQYPCCHHYAAAVAGGDGGFNLPFFSSELPPPKVLSALRFVCGISTVSSKVKEEKNQENGRKGGREGEKAVVSWIDIYLPREARPYAHLARLDKPIGTWLLAWPCFWSISLAAAPGHMPDFKMMALFGCGALLLRGAGCTINDLLDRDIDTKVERTKLRPVASGLLTPFQGLCFLGFQLLLGLGILLQLNNYSRILGASSLFLVFSYPLMKRITFWPQAYLGLTFNWGALLGWSAVKGSLDPSIVLPLYLGGVFWTLVYDTIYAHQDKEDDLKVGVKSTALRFGDSTREWTTGFGIACIGSLALSGSNADIGWPFYAFLAAASGQLAWQIWTVDLSCRADCNRKFVSNKWFGALIFSGILFGRIWS